MKNRIIAIVVTVVLALLMTAGMGRAFVSQASVVYSMKMDVVVASDDGYCNFRFGPGIEYGIIQPLYNGTRLTVETITLNSSDGLVWGSVSYNGYSGWISMRTTNVSSIWTASTAWYDVRVTMPDYIYLRGGPGSEFTSFYRPYEGQVLRINQTIINPFDGRPWGRTTINGVTGWVSLNWTYRDSSAVYNQTSDLTFSHYSYRAVVHIGEMATYFNEGPGMSYPLIEWVPNGTSLLVVTTMNNSQDGLVWGETRHYGKFGWIPMNYTSITEAYDACTVGYYVSVENSSNIILRSGPGGEYREIINYIPNGTVLYITQTVVNDFDGRPWGKTNYNGQDGWVSLNWTYRAPGN